jgi:hypothetical protein
MTCREMDVLLMSTNDGPVPMLAECKSLDLVIVALDELRIENCESQIGNCDPKPQTTVRRKVEKQSLRG